MADMRQMGTDLMGASRPQFHLKPGKFPRLHDAISRDDLQSAMHRIIRDAHAGDLRILAQICPHDRFPTGRAPLHPAGIKLMKRAFRKRAGRHFISLVSLGKQKKTPGLHVQPVAQPNVVCRGLRRPAVGQNACERAVSRGRIFFILREKALRLVNQQDLGILIDNGRAPGCMCSAALGK